MAQETEYRLRKIQFTKALRGYSCEEVDTYLAYVYDRYATLAKECSDLKKKMAVMAAGQNEFREDALREKDKIAAEADALVKEKELAAGKLMEDAKRKAAGLLADAETAAAGILKRAEAEAAEIRTKQQEEDETALQNAGRLLAERNNAADRLVEEIDSFREEIFAMYARHIEELERLAQRTDAFYQTKEELTEGLADGSEPDVQPMDLPTDAADDGELYMPVEEADTLSADEAESEPAEELWSEPEEEAEGDDEDLLRIDWKKYRAGREDAESEQMAEKTLWEIADEAAEQDSWNTGEDPEEELEDLDNLDDLEDVLHDGSLPEDGDLLDALASLTEEYEEDASDAAEEDDGAFELLTEDEYQDDAQTEEEFSEEDFLSDIASEYITPSRTQTAKTVQEPKKQPAGNAGGAERKKKPGDLDELFYDDAKNVSLTGEFDIIFNSKKSAANVTQISRQPLVEAAKPDKPKKHSTK